jgi:hypothetical protein
MFKIIIFGKCLQKRLTLNFEKIKRNFKRFNIKLIKGMISYLEFIGFKRFLKT